MEHQSFPIHMLQGKLVLKVTLWVSHKKTMSALRDWELRRIDANRQSFIIPHISPPFDL